MLDRLTPAPDENIAEMLVEALRNEGFSATKFENVDGTWYVAHDAPAYFANDTLGEVAAMLGGRITLDNRFTFKGAK